MSSSLVRVPIRITRSPLATRHRPAPTVALGAPLSTPSAALPAASNRPCIVPPASVLDHVQGIESCCLSARVDLRGGWVDFPATYGTAKVYVKPNTHCDIVMHVGYQGGQFKNYGGTVKFCKPLKVSNPLHAFIEPAGLWKVGKPLMGWGTTYAVDGLCIDAAGNRTVIGKMNVLHSIRSRRLNAYATRKANAALQRTSLAGQGPLGMSPDRAIQLAAHLAASPVAFTFSAQGTVPNPLCIDAGGDNFISLSGGPVSIGLTGTMTLGDNGEVCVNLPAQGSSSILFSASALQAQLAANLVGVVYGQGSTFHVRGNGSAQAVIDRARFDVRPKESPSEGGIQVVAGDFRRVQRGPALLAPVQFTLQDSTVKAQGTAQIQAAATFLNPGEPVPASDDESSALDVHGSVNFSLDGSQRAPSLQAAGTVYLAPPGSDPFGYKISLTPKGADFEPIAE